ncbi:RNA polymerase sigma factor [Labilithrix luteola]|nr:sigma-70 family RNA polymerase sigma factor [Labilithrix luteola]
MMLPRTSQPDFLERFHAGEHAVIEACYREHGASVLAAATRILPTIDAEAVVHDVFYRLLTDTGMRSAFSGGNLGAWLSRVATNAAIDVARRRRRETSLESVPEPRAPAPVLEEISARSIVDRFRDEILPEKYRGVFEARFVKQLPQREAAATLSMQRSTLAYQEERIREMLRKFVLGKDAS